MRFLQLLLVASLVSIGIGVVFQLSTGSTRVELRRPDVLPSADADVHESRVGPARAVANSFSVTATREAAAPATDDGAAAAAIDPAHDGSEGHVVTLRGRVVDAESGAPLEGASVASTEIVVATPARTDREGAFEIEGTTGITTWVYLVASCAGFVSIQRKCEIDAGGGGAAELELPLRRGCLVVGRVELPAQIDASEVALTVEYMDADDGEQDHPDAGSVRPDGSFVIDSVLPGAVVVLQARVGDHARGATLPIRVPPAAGSVVSADVPLIVRANCTIRLHSGWLDSEDERPGARGGDASIDPGDEVRLERLDRGEEFWGGAGPAEDGSCRFSDIPAGRYAVGLNSWANEADGLSLGTIELEPGDDRTFDLRKPPSLRVAGRFVPAATIVRDGGCSPPEKVFLTLAKPGTCLRTLVAGGGEKEFSFPSVPPGRYSLTASVATEPLEVEAGDTAVLVRAIGFGVVAGSIDVDFDARPVAVLTRANGVTSTRPCCDRVAPNDAPVFEFEECGPGPLRLEVVASGHRLLERTIDAPRGMERLDLGRLELEPAASLVGTVVDDRDRPLAGVVVDAIRALPRQGLDHYGDRAAIVSSTSSTDEAGRFELPFEPKLDRFELDLPDGEPVLVAASIERGRVLLQVPRLHAIRATLLTEAGLPVPDVRVDLAASTEIPFDRRRFGEATTDAGGRFTILTHATGLAELSVDHCWGDIALDVEPFTLDDADRDLGTLVLRH